MDKSFATCDHDCSDGSVFQRPDHWQRLRLESVLEDQKTKEDHVTLQLFSGMQPKHKQTEVLSDVPNNQGIQK